MTLPGKGGIRLVPLIVLAVGVTGVSSGAIFARYADAHAFVKSAYRLGFASLFLVPAALLFYRHEYRNLTRRDLGTALLSGMFLAVHFGTWISSLDYTTVASSVMLVNTIPIWVVLINMLLGRGAPGRAMGLSVAMSVAGVCVIGYGDLSFSGAPSQTALFGDALAVAGAVSAAAYILCGKEVRKKISVTPYIALCYGSAAVLMWLAVLALRLEVTGFAPQTWGAFLGMAVVSQIVGHTSYNWALGHFSAGFVAVMLLGEPIGSAVLALVLFGEAPTPTALFGIALLMCAIVVAARSDKG